MIGVVARRMAAAPVARKQVRTLMDAPNKVLSTQQFYQKGATPYLRGDADPTYLRKSSDSMIALAMVGASAFGWLMVARNHFRMWGNDK
eukprot:CAMPEP_0184544876 /NCGR_PEP_ID=MMETSP0199_2-20130426/3922_1 /TAXON_ID=1112570 /ORGANISM="Thraustochytrium sp., Strain LLF1b" /LENGTH=88 /DNA_ID=CAMNT_0026939109 /DNA_START=103 /DNA_END=369 /DNA_ORIENTATION=-